MSLVERLIIPIACNLSLELFPTKVGCLGGDGSIVAEPRGTNHGVAYQWSTGERGPSITGLKMGFYSVTVTDSKGCTASNGVMVGDGCPCTDPTIQDIIVIKPSTQDSKDGVIKVVVQPTGNFKYEWSDPSISGPGGTGLMAGMYTVTISDAANSACSITQKIIFGHSDMTNIEITAITPTECGKAQGSATLSPSNYRYSWSDGGEGATRNDLAAGTYIVTGVDPNNPSNQDMIEVIIESIGGLAISNTVNALAQCGQNNGSVTINASGV